MRLFQNNQAISFKASSVFLILRKYGTQFIVCSIYPLIKTTIMKALILICILFIAGCKVSKFQTGTYRVESAKKMHGKSVVRLEGLKKEFVFATDTLKKGDLVYFAQMPEGIINSK
jgi:hypothetical protein